jgi:hypothetical protein
VSRGYACFAVFTQCVILSRGSAQIPAKLKQQRRCVQSIWLPGAGFARGFFNCFEVELFSLSVSHPLCSTARCCSFPVPCLGLLHS